MNRKKKPNPQQITASLSEGHFALLKHLSTALSTGNQTRAIEDMIFLTLDSITPALRARLEIDPETRGYVEYARNQARQNPVISSPALIREQQTTANALAPAVREAKSTPKRKTQ